jgi:hypothetical protein
MTETQMTKTLNKMRIADAVEVQYCNVLKIYQVKVWLNDRCKRGTARSRDAVITVAERGYCELISESY